MKKIDNFDLINEAGEFRRLPAGIYGVVITDVVDKPEDEYLEVYCDITKGEYKDYFKTLVQNGLPDRSKHIRSYKTNALPFFKAFITAVEKTNNGFKWDWDEKKLIGKNAIAVVGEEEYLDKNGEVKIGSKIVEFRSLEAYKSGKIVVPALKKLPENTIAAPTTTTVDVTDDELPF